MAMVVSHIYAHDNHKIPHTRTHGACNHRGKLLPTGQRSLLGLASCATKLHVAHVQAQLSCMSIFVCVFIILGFGRCGLDLGLGFAPFSFRLRLWWLFGCPRFLQLVRNLAPRSLERMKGNKYALINWIPSQTQCPCNSQCNLSP